MKRKGRRYVAYPDTRHDGAATMVHGVWRSFQCGLDIGLWMHPGIGLFISGQYTRGSARACGRVAYTHLMFMIVAKSFSAKGDERVSGRKGLLSSLQLRQILDHVAYVMLAVFPGYTPYFPRLLHRQGNQATHQTGTHHVGLGFLRRTQVRDLLSSKFLSSRLPISWCHPTQSRR